MPITKRPTLVQRGLDFSGFGYFTQPICAPGGEKAAEWLELERLITALKTGDFSVVEAVLALCRASKNWRLRDAAAQVLGHTGSVDCYRSMRAELERLPIQTMEWVDVETRELILLYGKSFSAWGRLDVVPFLLDLYIKLRQKKTAEIAMLPIWMDRLLNGEVTMMGEEAPDDLLEDYVGLVLSEYEDAVERLQSAKVLVYEGELQSVRGLAEKMRHPVGYHLPQVLSRLRARFEPATGIDCSPVFTGPETSLAEASAIAEEFLASPASHRYEPGLRYFFGHCVPD